MSREIHQDIYRIKNPNTSRADRGVAAHGERGEAASELIVDDQLKSDVCLKRIPIFISGCRLVIHSHLSL